MLILNKYKDILEDLVESLDIKYPAILKQIDLSSNDILCSKNNPSNFEMENDFLDRLQGQQQCRITPPILCSKNGDKKVREGKGRGTMENIKEVERRR